MTNLEKHLNGELVGKYTLVLSFLDEYGTQASGSFSTDNFLEFLKVTSFIINDRSVIFANAFQEGKRVHFSGTKETYFDVKKNIYFLPRSILEKFDERRD